MPTQQFFNEDMAVPMRMVPDYETYECRFEFGVAPTATDEADARNTPCLSMCTAANLGAPRCVDMGGGSGPSGGEGAMPAMAGRSAEATQPPRIRGVYNGE